MDILLLPKVPVALIILLSGEACQSIFIDVETERVDRSQGDIDPQIELITVDQQRVIYVFANYHRCALRDLVDVLCYKDALALRRG